MYRGSNTNNSAQQGSADSKLDSLIARSEIGLKRKMSLKKSKESQGPVSTPGECVDRYFKLDRLSGMLKTALKEYETSLDSSVQYISQASRNEILKMILYMSKRVNLSTKRPDKRTYQHPSTKEYRTVFGVTSSTRLYMGMELLKTSLEYMVQAGKKFQAGEITQEQCARTINSTIGCLWNYTARQMPKQQRYSEPTTSLDSLNTDIKESSMSLRMESTISNCSNRYFSPLTLPEKVEEKILKYQEYLDSASEYIPEASKNEILKIMLYVFSCINLLKLSGENLTDFFSQNTIFLKPSLIVMEQAGKDFKSGKIMKNEFTDILNRTVGFLWNFVIEAMWTHPELTEQVRSSLSNNRKALRHSTLGFSNFLFYPTAFPSPKDVCLESDSKNAEEAASSQSKLSHS